MVNFIEEAVDGIRSSPDRGSSVELIIGYEPSHGQDLVERLNSLNVSKIECGPFNTLLISTLEENVDVVCGLDYIEDVELNSKGEVLSQGN